MTLSPKARAALAGRLRHAIEGEVLADEFSRGRYATDASPFQSFPLAIALPKTQDDVLTAVRLAWEAGVPVIARGGATGRAGQSVGEGLVIDFTKYLTRLLYYDASAQSCIVEPGITPAALNTALTTERVWFPVEIGSAMQATIGGMAATDAVGSRTLLHGRMRDNITACDAVLAHGAEISFGEVPDDFAHSGGNSEETALILDLLEAAENNEAAIRALPSILGGQHGFNVPRLLSGEAPQNMAEFLAGSEGTLAVARRIELKLARMPKSRALGVCHFATLGEALRAVDRILTLEPTDVELTSGRIFELGLAARDAADPARRLLRKDGGALLLVEFMHGNNVTNARKLKELGELMAALGRPRSVSELIGPAAQEAVRRAHRIGIARLYGATQETAAFARIDQIALPLPMLAHAAERLTETFSKIGMEIIWHGQIGAGAVYMRPWLRIGEKTGEAYAAARDAFAVLQDFKSQFAAVEGYGLARSFDAETMREPALTALFEEIKTRFDPKTRLNPGKIVLTAQPTAQMIRSVPQDDESAPRLAALNCDGTALCRRLDKTVMCPSFKLTRDERDSPRGRANSLRLALSGEFGPGALASDEMAETMSLCVSCKACRSECPRAADIAQAKIAVQRARAERDGLSKFETSLAFLPHTAPRMRRWRHLLNLRDLLPWGGRLSERLTGFSADRPWPHWSAAPFPPGRPSVDGEGAEILLFQDTFNSHFDPVTLRSAADVLAASGFRVHRLAPPDGERPYCCGRTFLEAGLVEDARAEAERLIAAAAPFIEKGIPLVGVEPACLLTIRDDFVNTLAVEGARGLAAASLLFEEVMSQSFAARTLQPHLLNIEAEALFAAHCHQRSFNTAHLARKVAGLVPGINVIEADPTCCGMGTSFGYRPEMAGNSFRMGELSLFPQIRRTTRDTLLIADGFACRKQISDGTGRTARHTAVLLKLALTAKEKFGGQNDQEFLTNKRLSKRLNRLRRHYFR